MKKYLVSDDFINHFCSAADNLGDLPFPKGWAEQWAAKAAKLLDNEIYNPECRLVSYAPDMSTCTLNFNGQEYYFNKSEEDSTQHPHDTLLTDESIINMAREAGLQLAINAEVYPVITEQLKRFTAIVSAAIQAKTRV